MASKEEENRKIIAGVLKGHSPTVLEWVETLRRLVRETLPEAQEVGKKGWRNICYEYNGIMIYIDPTKDGVNFGFYQGTSLPDPDHLLIGSGTKLRHVKIKKSEDLRIESLTRLVEEAYKLRQTAGEEAEKKPKQKLKPKPKPKPKQKPE